MNSAIIVAGGTGSRFGGDIPKQFMEIGSKEILSYSVETFSNHAEIQEVIIVCHKDWIEHTNKNYKNCTIVMGGEKRKKSSLNGVLATDMNSENILIHDAARPMISSKIISDCLSALKYSDASAPIIDSTNSLVNLEENQVLFVNRQNIKLVQTPQCFKRNLILDVLNSSIEGTDEIGMLLNFDNSKKILLVDGEANNIKVTTKIDLVVATSILEGLN